MNHSKIKKNRFVIVVLSCVIASFSFGQWAFAASSADFSLDFDSVTTGSEYFKSADFQLQSGTTSFETNSTSADFNLATINLVPAPAVVSICGNGIIEAGESCDGASLAGQTCIAQGFNQGALSCTASCTFDTSACSNTSTASGGSGGGSGNNIIPYNPPVVTAPPVEPESPSTPNPQQPISTIPTSVEPPSTELQPSPAPIEPEEQQLPATNPPATPLKPETKDSISSPPKNPPAHPAANQPIPTAGLGIIDQTPLIVSDLEPEQEYELQVINEFNQIIETAKVYTDEAGRYLYESENTLSDGNYVFQLKDLKQNLLEEYRFTIRQKDYDQFMVISFGNLQNVINDFDSVIDLGKIVKKTGIKITGHGIPGARVHAYFQSQKIFSVETTVNPDGSCAITIPQGLELGYHDVRIIQVHPDGTPSKNLTYRFELIEDVSILWLIFLIATISLISIIPCCYRQQQPKKKTKKMRKLNSLVLVVAITSQLISPFTADAAVPQTMLYEGRLLNSSGVALTTAHTFRISLWKDTDWVAGDELGSGAINTAATNYGGWFEEHTITPNANGTFSIKLGTLTALPDIDFATHKFLQIEVKPSASPITSYQLLDPTGDNGVDTTDRKTIGSVPYALNSEKAEKSNQETFTLDNDNTIQTAGTGNINLRFGGTLGKILAYDTDNTYFNFNDDVNIDGNLTVTGTIELNSAGNSIKFNATGLTADREVTFNDANTTVVGEANTQTLTNKTIDGDDNTLQDIPQSALKDKNKTILLKPEFDKMTIVNDGTSNLASIKQNYDAVNDHIFYYLTSAQPTLQDLDLYIAIQVPSDFQSFQATPLQMAIRSTTTAIADNQIDVSLTDTTNSAVTLVGATDLVSSVADTWIEKNITFSGLPTFTADDFIILRLNMQSKSNNKIYISEIKFNYIGK